MADFNFGEITMAEKITPSKKQILWVDDDRFYIKCGLKVLEVLGHAPLTAKSGRQAIKIYREHDNEIRLVILGMTIPDVPWRDVYKELIQIDPALKVLVVTGTKGTDLMLGLPQNGTVYYFRKPFTIDELSERITALLAGSRPFQQSSPPYWGGYRNNQPMGAMAL